MIQQTSEQAWQNYKHIENLVITARKLNAISSNNCYVDYALQRLCQAVLQQHQLNKTDHFEFLQNIKIKSDNLKLSTIKEMYNAKIYQWKGSIESVSVGGSNDNTTYTTERDEGYIPQLSMTEVLNWNYEDFEARVNITPQTAWNTYKAIEKDVQAKCKNETNKNRVQNIEKALNRLCQAVLNKYNLEKPLEYTFSINVSPPSPNSNTLYSTHSMMNAKIKVWEEEIPRFSFNYNHLDYFLTGRQAGYYPKPSLAEALNP